MNRKTFFTGIRPLFGRINNLQVAGVEKILDAWEKSGYCDERWLAYILATVFHETGKRMTPVTEMGGEAYLHTKKYYPYYGRDLVQTTWKYNYEKVKAFTGVDVVNDPELIKTVAADVAIEFMAKGYYTGKKLSDYFLDDKEDPVGARRIINGQDKASQIASYYRTFKGAIVAA